MADLEIISRGFVYVRESEELIEEVKVLARDALVKSVSRRGNNWTSMRNAIKDELNSFLYKKTKRRPMIIPIIVEVQPQGINRMESVRPPELPM